MAGAEATITGASIITATPAGQTITATPAIAKAPVRSWETAPVLARDPQRATVMTLDVGDPPAAPRPAASGADPAQHAAPQRVTFETSGADAPHRAAPRRRRRGVPERLLIASIALTMILILLLVGAYGYVRWQISRIPRIDLAEGVLDDVGRPVSLPAPPATQPAPRPSTSGSTPADPAPIPLINENTAGLATRHGSADAQNILIVGTDDRDAVPDGSVLARNTGKGKVSGQRSDTIMILRIDPRSHQAWVLSIPRDLWVRNHATGRWTKINSTYAKDPANLIVTIKATLGIPIHRYAEVDFVGFQRIVGAVDGVDICFNYPTRDTITGLNQLPGCNRLGPDQAIAFVRSRKYEEDRGAGWKPDGRGDLGRIVRQQEFIRSTLSRSIDQGARNPLTLNALLNTAREAVRLDDGFGFEDVTDLANEFRQFDPNALEAVTVPAVPDRADRQSILRLDATKAVAVVGRFQ